MPGAPDSVLELIERFDRHLDAYRSGTYGETQVRVEFIDPLAEALGWDVKNRAGYAEAYKDVIHEDAIKVGGTTKAPDYCFRIGGDRKFFLEAKKPSVNIAADVAPAYQLRRYAWSAKLPLSILTDFEEFAVYDCRLRPRPADKASTARTMYLGYADYADRWDEIASVFSKEAVLQGSFDKYVIGRKRRGTAEVDAEFLKEIEKWRDALARNIALRNPNLDTRQLNFAVQGIVDRIIFLRMCEDRGVEVYGALQGLINGADVYGRLLVMFRAADDRYNSGLFHFTDEKDRPTPPDTLTETLTIDDNVLKDIFRGLYYPQSPYEFAVLPADILGNVYEQFLGKVIHLTAGHRARVEEKPEVKKAGGVYYTPRYIVDYIVEHTVGKLIEGKTPRQIARLRICDPACGSGSFLIGAYRRLLDYHRDWYVNDDPKKHTKQVYQGAGGQWHLTTAAKKSILLNSIFGVDIDPQAVEVTKLNLLLAVLENENQTTLGAQLKMFHERRLPDLGANIKCGNSLIGTDFYEGKQLALFDENAQHRINAFDWEDEFPEVFGGKDPGFDAVIGNPPYIRMEAFKELKAYLKSHYACHEERSDLYAYFLEKAVAIAAKQGRVGMIVSNKFIRAKYGRPLRKLLHESVIAEVIADFGGEKVFRGATVRAVVLVVRMRSDSHSIETLYVPAPCQDTLMSIASGRLTVDDYARRQGYLLREGALSGGEWQLMPGAHARLLEKLRYASQGLNEFIEHGALFGLKTGLNEAFVITEAQRVKLVSLDRRSRDIIKPILFGMDVRRYHLRPAGRYVIYCHPNKDIEDYPAVREHLLPYRARLQQRASTQSWYHLQQPAVPLLKHLSKPKLVYPIIAPTCRFTLDEGGYFMNDKLFMLPVADPALLGVLNSRVANFYFGCVCAALEGSSSRYLEFRAQYVDRFPIPPGAASSEIWSRLQVLAKEMLDLHKDLGTRRTDHSKRLLQRRIAVTDKQIDALVYGLYGLTDDQIRIVEEATN